MTGQATAPAAELVPSEEQPAGALARLGRLQALQIIGVLAVIVIIFSALKLHSFLTVFNIRGIVQDTSILAVLGVGMTFVIITGGIDLSIGSVLVFSGVVADKSMAAMGTQGWGAAFVGLLVAVGCGLAWGLLNGFFIAKAKVPPLIVTLGSLGMALGLAEVITGGVDLRDIPNVMVNDIGFGNIFWEVPWLAVIAAIVVVIGIVLLHRTRFGLHTYAIGSNPEAGRRSGLNVSGQLIAIYAISGLLAGFAGWLNLAFYQSTTIGGQSTTNLSRHRRRRHRRHEPVRRLRVDLRQHRRLVHPGHPPGRIRDHRYPAVLAAGRGGGRAHRRGLRRPAAARSRPARRHGRRC